MRLRRAVALVGSVCASLVLTQIVATASPDAAILASPLPHSPTVAALTDADAARVIALQEPVAQVLSDVQLRFPNDYAGGRISTPQEPLKPMVAFKGSAPPEARSMLAALAVPVDIRENIGQNADDLHNLAVTVAASLQSEFKKAFSVSSGSDQVGSLVVRAPISPVSQLATGVSSKLTTAATVNAFLKGAVPLPSYVKLVVEDSVGEGSQSARYGPTGGSPIDSNVNSSGGLYGCTTAFTVRSNSGSGDLGPLTAQHCADGAYNTSGSPNFWHISNGARAFQLEYRRGVFNGAGDAAFYRSPVMEDAVFDSGSGQFRPVYTWVNSSNGAVICRYGRVTGRGCSTVIDTNWCGTDGATGVVICTYLTDTKTGTYGDSGGPVFANTTAHGVWRGWRTGGGDIYTGMSQALYQTNTSLCTDYSPYPKCW